MKNILTFFLLLFAFSLLGQTIQYSRIKVDLTQKSIVDLAKLGLAVDHGIYKKGRFLINEFSNAEIEKIRAAGFEFEVLIDDLDDFYKNHNQVTNGETRSSDDCFGAEIYDYVTPENFELGSFMGFLTYEEMLENLDSMAAKFPDLISPRQPIDTFLTFENRPVYWLKISDNPLVEEDEPEALYTSLHHAREPNSLSSVIFYMWYLLENYETDPSIQYLVNNTELYFVPCVNPDGYIYNVTNYQNGGSIMWRKNRRDNEDGNFGIDLNRNYDFEWGYDDIGSSSFTGANTYRGTEPASEPEIKAMQMFCNEHEFQLSLNNHTYGNYLLYPWNYLSGGIPADTAFLEISKIMTSENQFFAGTFDEALSYTANGNSDDWMFGETISKPPIYAFTPEIGPGGFGFYPPESEIVKLCKSVLFQNLTTGFLLLNYGEVKDQNDIVFSEINDHFKFGLTRYGLMDGSLTVSLSPISENIEYTGNSKVYNLDPFSNIEDSIAFILASDISAGDEIVFLLSVDNGSLILSDTITKVFGQQAIIMADNGDNLGQWDETTNSTHLWGVTSDEYYSESSSITDSPDGFYFAWQENYLEMDTPVSLLDSTQSFLTFWAKWDIENDFDYAQVSISTNGFSYTPLCGKYTNLGTQYQIEGEPLYDGEQLDWVKEEIDLTDYKGQDIYLRFSMISDAVTSGDGFYFDDLKIISIVEDIVNVESVATSSFIVKTNPNPASDRVKFECSEQIIDGEIRIYNALGQLIHSNQINDQKSITIATSGWSAGLYLYQITSEAKLLNSGRIMVLN